MAKVIITGGTGLVGRRLSELLITKGFEVNILTRYPKNSNDYKWDVSQNLIDESVFKDAIAIFHLAGAGITEKRWSDERKKKILESRTEPTQLLYNYLSKNKHSILTFISASAVGFYGNGKDELLTEESPNGTDFLATVCKQWEEEAEKITSLNIRVIKVRIGIVLSKNGGALSKLDLPIRFGIGAYLGDGKQFVPWIHIDDLCNIFIHLLENKILHGAYNGCAPDIKTNKQMSETIAKALHRPFIPMPAPVFFLKTILGEMSSLLLMSNNCSSHKILQSGFQFRYPILIKALENIYSSDNNLI